MRVIVVDDNPDDRALAVHEVCAVFPQAELAEPTDLAAFHEVLRAAQPDLVLTDLDLRWSDGGRILADTKQAYPACPVIVFTGTGNETVAVDLMKAGLDDYVVKSARQLGRLRTSIRLAMEASETRRTLTQREAQLAAALKRQETIVRELHHRVRNNLQVITNLLLFRGRMTPPATRAELEALAGRMRALAAVQARIYDTETLDRVDFRAVLDDIATKLVDVAGGGQIKLKRAYEIPLDLDVSRAMPLGLLVYEIILNAARHAWPDEGEGTLIVEATTLDGYPTLRFCDDGVGFVSADAPAGLGTQLMRALTGEARVELDTTSRPNGGTTVSLRLL